MDLIKSVSELAKTLVKESKKTSLSKTQKSNIVSSIKAKNGPNLSKQSFADQVLAQLEDIAGFEAVTEQETEFLVDVLWKVYKMK